MGTVYADITLKNASDLVRVRDGHLPEQEIREVETSAMVDTGSFTLIIGEAVREKLGLELREKREVSLANNAGTTCQVAEPVEIHWKDRRCVPMPWVLPGAEEVLLGSLPLEDMDLMVDPGNQELIGRHGDVPRGRV